MNNSFSDYAERLSEIMSERNWDDVSKLAKGIREAWSLDKQVFICGNGGSAANAIHLANDLLYGATDGDEPGIRVEALSANPAVLTCLANDISYDEINKKFLDKKNNEASVGKIEKMSKSKKNVIDPTKIIEIYGADTARWFMLSDSPPDRDLEWTDAGIGGAYKFINKIWNLLIESVSADSSSLLDKENYILNEKVNETIINVTKNINDFHYNKSIANLYELTNVIQSLIIKKTVSKDCLLNSFKKLTLLLHPFVPHLSEEMWAKISGSGLAINQKWPKFTGSLAKSFCNIAIQVNGKTKEVIQFNIGSKKENVQKVALEKQKIKKIIMNKKIIKIIFIPNKILNIVLL